MYILLTSLAAVPAQLALAWVMHQAPHIVTIPGTSRIDHLKEQQYGGVECSFVG
jgi:aryl-alcohol dehydrogenase-like predicted oxidoreductase